jgi:hypothetical protein
VKKKEMVALGKRLLQRLDGLSQRGSLIFIAPITHTLRGFDFDPSIDKNVFYLTSFFKPLCVPSKHLTFNFGQRLKGVGWHVDTIGLEAELLEAMQSKLVTLKALQTPRDVVKEIESWARAGNPKDVRKQEALAYMRARAGEVPEAVASLYKLFGMLDPKIPWHREVEVRGRALALALEENPRTGRQMLARWELETVHNLGLAEFYRADAEAASFSV